MSHDDLVIVDTQNLLHIDLLQEQLFTNMTIQHVISKQLSAEIPNTIQYTFNEEKDYERFHMQHIFKKDVFNGLLILIDQTQSHAGMLHETTEDDWHANVTAHLSHAFCLARLAVDEYLSRSSQGKITFLVKHNDNTFAKVLKTSFTAFCRSIAKEYGRRDVYCNAIYFLNNSKNTLQDIIPLALYLTSSASTFITGEVIDV